MFVRSNGAVARACFVCLLLLSFAAASARGAPPSQVAPGERYVYMPVQQVPSTAGLRFEIDNKPRWLSFSASNGLLTGIPSSADVGIYDNIRIWITNGTYRASIPLFTIRVRSADAHGQVSLSWMPPLENSDGSALTDLAGYRIYSGRSPSDLRTLIYIRTPAVTRGFINMLESGRHYFAITAVNAAGIESELSGIVSALIP